VTIKISPEKPVLIPGASSPVFCTAAQPEWSTDGRYLVFDGGIVTARKAVRNTLLKCTKQVSTSVTIVDLTNVTFVETGRDEVEIIPVLSDRKFDQAVAHRPEDLRVECNWRKNCGTAVFVQNGSRLFCRLDRIDGHCQHNTTLEVSVFSGAGNINVTNKTSVGYIGKVHFGVPNPHAVVVNLTHRTIKVPLRFGEDQLVVKNQPHGVFVTFNASGWFVRATETLRVPGSVVLEHKQVKEKLEIRVIEAAGQAVASGVHERDFHISGGIVGCGLVILLFGLLASGAYAMTVYPV
jgi:hypothetical protein